MPSSPPLPCRHVVTQVSHIQDHCQADVVLDETDPFKRQAQTSMDYSQDSWLTIFLTGGLVRAPQPRPIQLMAACAHTPRVRPYHTPLTITLLFSTVTLKHDTAPLLHRP